MSLLLTAKTSSASSRATAACWSPRSIKRCATARHYGPRDAIGFPDAAGARVERHQIANLPDPHSTRGIGTGIARTRLPIPVVAVYAGLRSVARQSGCRLRRAANPDGLFHALPGRLRDVPVSRPE